MVSFNYISKLGLPRLYAFALCLRIVLLVYGRWQDANMDVKFTDVDYHVFDDAAQFAATDLGTSPYLRATYRYTPLLAWILRGNVHFKNFGKCLFITADFLTAVCVQRQLQMRGATTDGVFWALAMWLLNPITCAISCRGNAESIMALFVNGVLYALMSKWTGTAGVVFGVAVHFKIYPVVYALAIFLFLGNGYDGDAGRLNAEKVVKFLMNGKLWQLTRTVVTGERLRFFVAAAFSFFCLNALMYALYGFEFLEHSYLYHVRRRDIRHNFSVFFYMIYLGTGGGWQSLVCFVLQASITVALSMRYSDDLPFAFFVLTTAFVAFNKIATSQYFIWYLSLVPVLVPAFTSSSVSIWSVLQVTVSWFIGQAVWLYKAYQLEFLAHNQFFELWMASLLFFVINVYILVWFMDNYRSFANFNSRGVLNQFSCNHTSKID